MWEFIEGAQKESTANLIQIPTVYNEAIPSFIKEWLDSSKDQSELWESMGVQKTETNKFFTKMRKYFLRAEFVDPLIGDFEEFFENVNYSSAVIIRDYLLWIIGEKLYFLEHQETNGTPEEPIAVPHGIDFHSYITNIWRKQLPEIYINNYEMRESTPGDRILEMI